MSIFSAAWAGIKTVFGGEPNKAADLINDSVRGVGGWIDEQQFTDQEKAEMNMKLVENYAVFMENTMKENTERSRTRRNLAIWIIRTFIYLLITSVIFEAMGNPHMAEFVFKIMTSNPYALLVGGVGAFFFGTHLIREAK